MVAHGNEMGKKETDDLTVKTNMFNILELP